VIEYWEKDGSLTFNVQVVPRASCSEIVGEHDGALRVRIAVPPVEGAANQELVRILARAFGVAKNSVEITGGQTSKRKKVCVIGVTSESLRKLLAQNQIRGK